jgi:hypothetical protein
LQILIIFVNTLVNDKCPANGQRDLHNAEDYLNMAITNHLARFPMFTLLREWNMAGPSKFHNNPLTFKLELKKELHEELSVELPVV